MIIVWILRTLKNKVWYFWKIWVFTPKIMSHPFVSFIFSNIRIKNDGNYKGRFWRENSNIYLWKIEKIVVARKCCKMRLLWQSKLYFQIMGQEDVKVRRCSNKLSSSKATFISSLRRETEAIIARCYTTLCSTKAPEENKNREENAYWKKNMVVWQCLKII